MFPAVLVVVLLLTGGPPAAAQDAARMSIAVDESIRTFGRLTIFDDVAVEITGHSVLVTGKVTTADKREELGRRLSAIPGVIQVRNEVSVLPASTTDDVLRSKIARAIYGHPAFWQYASLPQPPIRIIVEDGAVTLSGTVPSEGDRALALALATGCGERSTTNALRTRAAR